MNFLGREPRSPFRRSCFRWRTDSTADVLLNLHAANDLLPLCTPAAMARIFICYRRSDASGHAGWLHENLVRRFGKSRVYRDIDNIPPGSDFVKEVQKTLSNCAAVIVLIGRHWLSAENRTRLNRPDDFVRAEIAQALKRNIPVYPVRVDGAGMPGESNLPAEIQALARKHAIEIRDVSFPADFEQLARSLERLDGLKPKASRSKPSSATSRGDPGVRKSAENAERGRTSGRRKAPRAASAPPKPAQQHGTSESGKTGTESSGRLTRRGSTAGASNTPRNAAPTAGAKAMSGSTAKPERKPAPKAGAKPISGSTAKSERSPTPKSGTAGGRKKPESKPKGASGGTGGGGARSSRGGGNTAARGSRNAGKRGGARGARGHH